MLGRRLDVLVEGADPRRPGFVRGTACRYVTVVCRGHAPALVRRRIPVRTVAVSEGVMLGEAEAEGASLISIGPAFAAQSAVGVRNRSQLALDISPRKISVRVRPTTWNKRRQTLPGAASDLQEGRNMIRPYRYIDIERRGEVFVCACGRRAG